MRPVREPTVLCSFFWVDRAFMVTPTPHRKFAGARRTQTRTHPASNQPSSQRAFVLRQKNAGRPVDCARARRSRRARTMDCNVENLRLGGLIFDAAFDSGNLANVEQRGASDFILTTKCDVANVPNRGTWFYFSVRCDDSSSGGGGIPPWNERILQFEVRNMNAQVALFGQGMRPVMRCRPAALSHGGVRKVSGTAAGDFAIHFTHKVSTPACGRSTLPFACLTVRRVPGAIGVAGRALRRASG